MASLDPESSEQTHLSEEELVWLYYEEAENIGDLSSHLSVCGQCRTKYEELKADLLSIEGWQIPERSPEYAGNVWKVLIQREPALARKRKAWRHRLSFSRMAVAMSVMAMVCVAFFIGRYTKDETESAQQNDVRQQLLAADLSDHLEQSERVLLELANSEQDQQGVRIDRQRVENLLRTNRLYRLAAGTEGHASLAVVLEDLERILLDVANGPEQLSTEQLDALKIRMDDQELLFKVRVLELRLRKFNPASEESLGEREWKG